ncbi:dihydroxyacetone kinase phosphoryl donor subunit DhaM [Mycoplasmopsis alligatoris]|uniref:phosphoenolpyruvate--glycerone phosphotransferase n=1 Tax=Mycoplasmopsis alligatoris A21JP2 TaxID=747682 RepID=D4XUY7_9BACT|nr:dihydroxyacetone kinase phosphoryl donor subunit DhaM [Mycoplasmopsis alligatoris]EFF41875.1 dihydroxyacetone kinase, phosphotransfer subunit [Mycoplasmopsis alligatoris A21JP2]
MVNILIISHSYNLAKGVFELASEMKSADFKFDFLGGTKEGKIGSDGDVVAQKIKDMIENNDQLLILADLGSSIMNSEMALDFELDDEQKQRVVLAKTPFLESSIIAVVQAGFVNSAQELYALIQNDFPIIK